MYSNDIDLNRPVYITLLEVKLEIQRQFKKHACMIKGHNGKVLLSCFCLNQKEKDNLKLDIKSFEKLNFEGRL